MPCQTCRAASRRVLRTLTGILALTGVVIVTTNVIQSLV